MVTVVVITHSKFAQGLLAASDLIMGPVDNLFHFGLFEGQGAEDLKANIYQTLSKEDRAKGILFLVDLFGATPYNVALKLYNEYKKGGVPVRVIAGVNLPILIEAIDSRTRCNLDELYKVCLDTGKNSIVEGVDFLKSMAD